MFWKARMQVPADTLELERPGAEALVLTGAERLGAYTRSVLREILSAA